MKRVELVFCLLIASQMATAQTNKEIRQFRLKVQKENLRTLFLGAINFCSDTEYETILGNPRKPIGTVIEGGNCCTSLVRDPYINLTEYFIYAMDGDTSIFMNRDNPFKLRDIRKQWENRVNQANAEARKMDVENLVYKSYRTTYVSTYDMNNEKILFGIGNSASISFGGVQGDWYGTIDFRYSGKKAPLVTELNVSMSEGEKLFNFFEKNKRNPNLPAEKVLNSKITYALELPERNNYLSFLLVRVKKVEYFYPNGWDKKIGEVIF